MCEQTEIQYLDGEVVWVKLGSCWWPGEVVDPEKLPPDFLSSFRKPPIAVVKFFQEDSYEFVKNINCIYKYNCSRKSEFIKKGLDSCRTKHGHMEKFPSDIVQAETATNGDVDILSRSEFQETKKESYAGLFGNPKKTTVFGGKRGRGTKQKESESPHISTPIRKISKGNPDYKVHILLQGSKSTPQPSEILTPSTSRAGSEPVEDRSEKTDKPDKPTSLISTPVASTGGVYACHACSFSTSRLNVMILHNKTHSVSYTPYTPSPVRKKQASKPSPNSSKSPKARKPRKEKTDKEPKKAKGQKRSAESQQGADAKKAKTDEEIKTSLLADWDDMEEESNGDASPAATPASPAVTPASPAAAPASPAMGKLASPETPVAAESPAVPISAELTAQVPAEVTTLVADKKPDDTDTQKPESSSDSKYEFCEDEDWPTEADGGRKIPRVKNPSKRKDETKSISIDEDEMAKEVAELLSKTTVPDLPSAPEPLKAAENFPEPYIVKSPDKKVIEPEATKSPEKIPANKPPTKTIFKTKTFFRSRHSRSQDAIGKYVAEQLNAVDRMSTSDLDLNGLEVASSPEARDSPPGDIVKVARLAPKIQLKKMKAEAAQLAEKEKNNLSIFPDPTTSEIPEATSSVHLRTPTSRVPYPSMSLTYDATSLVHTSTSVAVDPSISLISEVTHPLVHTTTAPAPVPSNSAISEATYPLHTSTSLAVDPSILVPSISVISDSNDPPAHKSISLAVDPSISDPSISVISETAYPLVQTSTSLAVDTSISDSEISISSDVTCPIVQTSTSLADPSSSLISEATCSLVQKSTSLAPDLSVSVISETVSESCTLVYTSTSPAPNPSFPHVPDNEASLVLESNSQITSTIREDDNVATTETIVKVTPKKMNEFIESPSYQEDEISDKSHQLQEIVEEVLEPVHVETITSKSVEKDSQMYMNESTASAVDALLSVSSREADRVTKTISNDLPEDLFEDDKVDTTHTNNVNGLEQSNFGFNNGDIEQFQENRNEVNELKLSSLQYDINGGKQGYRNDFDEKSEVANSENEKVTTEMTDQVETEVICQDANNSTDEESSHITEEIPDVISEEVTNVITEEINFVTEEVTTEEITTEEHITEEVITDSIPSESDLQIAEALMNLPATALKNKVTIDLEIQPQLSYNSIKSECEAKSDEVLGKTNSKFDTEFPKEATHEDVQSRFETEQEKCENLNAAQSLVQMSETLDHKLKNVDTNKTGKLIDTPTDTLPKVISKENNNVDNVEQNIALLSDANKSEVLSEVVPKFKTTSSKLLKILEEPSMPKMTSKVIPSKHIITAVHGKEKILNLDVANSPLKIKTQSQKQKIIIRRAPPHKNLINNLNESTKPEKLVLSRSNKSSVEGPSVQTYTIKASPDTPTDSNPIVIQQKMRKIVQTPTKLQKPKTLTSLVAITPEAAKPIDQMAATDEALYDINSMPIVLSDDILTPESIEKMPIVMSDNIISSPAVVPSHSKSIKQKISKVEPEKIAISSLPSIPEMKTLLMNPVSDSNKVTTPNILSKSSKIRGSKPMLVIDKTTGKQKIIMTKESPSKEVKKTPTKTQMVATSKAQTVGPIAAKTEKFIILPTPHTQRQGRTQKIVIDPQTGKAHVLVAKSSDPPKNMPDNKPVSAKIVPSAPDGSSTGGGTVMIITNAQGTQSRIVLTPEHEKLLFPNKQLTNMSQIKTIAQRQAHPTTIQKSQTIVTSGQSAKATRIVSKQKSAIITSKGQLIVGGRVATTTQNVAPAPERPVVPKRVIAAEPKKIVQAAPKTNEPLIFLQQKSGAVMQLTAAQFEHLQKTGQIVQKSAATQPVRENKIVLQKSVTITSNEAVHPVIQKQQKFRASRAPVASPSPAKKMKQEIPLAPAPLPAAPPPPPPPLAPISHTSVPAIAPAIAPLVQPSMPTAIASSSGYPDLDNFEELLPSTAIVRQQEVVTELPPESTIVSSAPALALAPAPAPAPAATTQLSDGQLLAVPGEHFGGPPGSFYLCVEDNGTLTPIDNRPLMLENNQLVPMVVEPVLVPQPERRDILEAALANSDVFHADPPQNEAPDFRDLNANVSVHCRVSETSTTLNQPIMTPLEMPTKGDSEPAVPANLEDGLAVIGVTPHTIPTSLELPITVTDPRIAPKTTDPLSSNNYCATTLLPSHSVDMPYVSCEETEISHAGPISMPLLTEEDDGVGKSMPILTDEVMGERTASSVESALGSPSSLEARECEGGEGGEGGSPSGGAWSRRLLTPGSDSSEASVEIPLQPPIQISVSDLSQHS